MQIKHISIFKQTIENKSKLGCEPVLCMLQTFLYLLKFFYASFGKVVFVSFLLRRNSFSKVMGYYVRWIYTTGPKATDKEIKKEMSSLDREHPYPQLWTSLLHLWFLSSVSGGNLVCQWWDDGRHHRREAVISFSLTTAGQQLQLNPQRNSRQQRLWWTPSSQECLI